MKKNLSAFERVVRLVVVLIFGWLWLYSSGSSVSKMLFFATALWLTFEVATGACPLYRHFGLKRSADRLNSTRLFLLGLLAIQLVIAYEWLHAGWLKVTGTFLAALPRTLETFILRNPYAWYRDFLQDIVLPNAQTYGLMIEWSELLIAVSLIVCALLIAFGSADAEKLAYLVAVITLLSAAVLNANYWLASAWTGPTAATVNGLMFWSSLVLAYVWMNRYQEPRH